MGHSECEYMLKYVLQILCYGIVCMLRDNFHWEELCYFVICEY